MTDCKNDLLTESDSFTKLTHTFNSKIIPFTSPPISNGPLTLHYGLTPLSHDLLPFLQAIIKERHIIQKQALILSETPWNTTENRAVCHHLLRHPHPPQWIKKEHQKWNTFYTDTKNQFTDIVQIGMGGSILGPKAIIHALRAQYKQHVTPHFISSIDPIEINQTLKQLPLSSTLFVIVSKSGTTIETHHIWNAIKNYWTAHGHLLETLPHQSVSITCPKSPIDDPKQFRECFYIDTTIGGRFSVTSVVGGLITSMVYGPTHFDKILEGAYQLDQMAHFPLEKNISLLAACLTIIYCNLCDYNARAIIPYSEALHDLPDYLQQLLCESNGKQISKNGTLLPYATNPAIMTGIGTDAQHATFQQFHQGSTIIPIDFIGISNNTALNNHIVAQSLALHQNNRPSSILMLKNVSATTLGALISHYENTVLFEGLLWGINSFDQPGVELGKKILSTKSDPLFQQLFSQITGAL